LGELAAALAQLRQRLMGLTGLGFALSSVLSLGGDAPRVDLATQLLPRLRQSGAGLDGAFEALAGMVVETTSWPDIDGRRQALQSMLTQSRRQIESLAARQPQQAAEQLAKLFAQFGLRAGGGHARSEHAGRLAVARDILARSGFSARATEQPKPAATGAPQPQPATAIDPAVAMARSGFKAGLERARGLNDAVQARLGASGAGWAQAQERIAAFYWQAPGGRAALPVLQGLLNEVEASLQALRADYRQANAPLAALKVAGQELGRIRAGAGGQGLAPQTEQAHAQVTAWGQAGDAARGRLSERIDALAQWKQAAQGHVQALRAHGPAAAAAGLRLPQPPATMFSPQAVRAWREALGALLSPRHQAPARSDSPPARLPRFGQRSPPGRQPASPAVTGTRVDRAALGTAGEINERALRKMAEALRMARERIYEARTTQLAGGDGSSVQRICAEIYAQSGLAGLSVSWPQFLAQALQVGLEPKGMGAAGGVRASGAAAGGGGTNGSFDYPQPEQQPQQGRATARTPGGDDALRRLQGLLDSFPARPDHLRTWKPDNSVSIVPGNLGPDAQEAYARLKRTVGETGVNRMVNALVIGHGDAFGLQALADAWTDRTVSRRSLPKLSGQMLVDIGCVVFDKPFGTLKDLQTLAGTDVTSTAPVVSPFKGVLRPENDGKYVVPWIDPSLDDLLHFDRLDARPLTPEQVLKSPWFIDHLHRTAQHYEDFPERSPSALRPWSGPNEPGFAETAAAREAFWYLLKSAGLGTGQLRELPSGASTSWADAVRSVPELEGIDFARDFREVRTSFLEVIRHALGSRSQESADAFSKKDRVALGVKVEALRLAEATLSNEKLRSALFESLVHEFVYPDAIVAFGQSDDFVQWVTELLLQPTIRSAGLRMSWVADQLVGELKDAAGRISGMSLAAFPTRLRALEGLALGQNPLAAAMRDAASARAKSTQHEHEQLLTEVARSLLQSGLSPGVSLPVTAESLPDAIVKLLDQAGIRASLAPSADGGVAEDRGVPEFIVHAPESEAGAISSLNVVMDRVVETLSERGLPSRWKRSAPPP
jgi:hypothetical protein